MVDEHIPERYNACQSNPSGIQYTIWIGFPPKEGGGHSCIIRSWKPFAAADAGSFSKAAEEAYITPTAVIKQINLLEESLGVKLFDCTHRGLTLTKAGTQPVSGRQIHHSLLSGFGGAG